YLALGDRDDRAHAFSLDAFDHLFAERFGLALRMRLPGPSIRRPLRRPLPWRTAPRHAPRRSRHLARRVAALIENVVDARDRVIDEDQLRRLVCGRKRPDAVQRHLAPRAPLAVTID